METPPPIRICGAPKATEAEHRLTEKFNEPTKLDFELIRGEINRLEEDPNDYDEGLVQRYRFQLQRMHAVKQAYYRVKHSDPPPKSTSCCYYGC